MKILFTFTFILLVSCTVHSGRDVVYEKAREEAFMKGDRSALERLLASEKRKADRELKEEQVNYVCPRNTVTICETRFASRLRGPQPKDCHCEDLRNFDFQLR